MTSPSPRGSVRSRRSAHWMRRGGGALLASAFVHAAAAATIGGVLGATSRSARHAEDTVDVDVALVSNASADAPSPRATPATPATASPTRARPMRHHVGAPAVPDDDAAPPRFALSAGTVATGPAPAMLPGPATGSGASSTPTVVGEGAPTAVGERDVDVPARLLAASPLVYPPAARQAELELDLPVEIVVDTAGCVVLARALVRAGYGLDEAAVRALRAYRFSPASRAGRPVPVRMRWTVQFRLR